MDPEGSQGRRPASTAVERTRRASGSNKGAGIDVSQHPAAVAYQAAHPKRQIPRFGPYLLLQTLGEGEFGKVKLGIHATWGEEVAVKLIRRGNVENALRMSKVEREIEVLRKINHPNIVRLYDVIETDKYIGIVLEYASGGELFDHILAHRFLRERDACKLFAQLISGVSYIHQKKIVHRDLKLENLLLDRNRNVIITDFGFANRFEHRPDDLMQTSCGSPCYAAPELVISEGEYVGSAVDIWSCGVILYAMLAGYLPFDDDPANPDGDNINLLYKYIVTTPLTFPDYVSEAARDLLGRMLVPDPKHRADLATIMAHPWLQPYSAQFQLSVEQLEQQAIEQQHVKRMAYQRQIRKKQQQQTQAGQPTSTRAARAQSTRPAAPEDSSDLLYTSAASPSRRERAGASAIVLPSPTNGTDSELLTVDGPQTQDQPSGERKNRGYRHTIQLEYDVGTRDSAPPVPALSPVDKPAEAPSSKKVTQDTSTNITTPASEPSQPPPTHVRSTSASHATPPSAFGLSTGVRSASAGKGEPRAQTEDPEQVGRAISTDTGRGGSIDTNGRSLDFSMSQDGPHSPIPAPDVPSVQVFQPPTSPVDEADILAALTGGKTRSVKYSTTSTSGANASNGPTKAPSVKVDALEPVRSPVMLTPTTTESTGLPTSAPTDPAVSGPENKAKSVPAQTKPTDPGTVTPAKTPEPVLAPAPPTPVRNVSTTSSTANTPRSKSTRHTTRVEKPAEEEVGNTSVSSSKSRRKTLSLMVEPFQRPFRTRTPVEPTPERKDTPTQPPRSAPLAPPPAVVAPTIVTPTPATQASTHAPYKSNTERFMAEGPPAGPASATSKAKRVMGWFRKRSLASGEPAAPAHVPAVPLPPPSVPPAQTAPLRSVTQPILETKHSGGMDSLSTTRDQSSLQLPQPSTSTPVSIVKPSKPVVNRAGMRVHEGAVDQAMVTSGSPLDALSHAEAVLVEMGIAFTKESEWKFRCVRHKKRKGGISGSVGGLSVGVMGSAASSGVNARGLPMPPPPSFGGAGGMLRGLLRRSSAQPGVPAESESVPQQPTTEPIYGERSDDAQDEVRFFVELTRIDRWRIHTASTCVVSKETFGATNSCMITCERDAFLGFRPSIDAL
ncbi:Serine/Threonine kinase catalytic domain protein, partial [Rhizoctonia solani AG-3 Rhs1AP]